MTKLTKIQYEAIKKNYAEINKKYKREITVNQKRK